MNISMLVPALLAAAVSLLSTAQAKLPAEAIAPADAGYFEEQAPVETGKGWLALQRTEAGWELVSSQLRSEAVKKTDERGRTSEGMKLTSDHPDALTLLRHPALRPGPVVTAPLDFRSRHRPRDGVLNLAWKPTPYQLSERGLNVALSRGKTSQTIGQIKKVGDSEFHASLMWAGDLDRDGQLDLIVEFIASDASEVCLYLSSPAARGRLLKKVSCWGSG